MKKKQMAKKVMAVILAAGMMFGTAACGSDGNNSGDPERKDAASIKEENQAADKAEETPEEKDEITSQKKTVYP